MIWFWPDHLIKVSGSFAFSLIFFDETLKNHVCCILISFEEIIGSNQVFCALHAQKVGNHTGASGLFCFSAGLQVEAAPLSS